LLALIVVQKLRLFASFLCDVADSFIDSQNLTGVCDILLTEIILSSDYHRPVSFSPVWEHFIDIPS